MKTALRTRDIWQSAFLLTRGNNLEDIETNSNGKKEAIFILSGYHVQEDMQEFRTGQAMCNVASLKASMTHLKEEMYKVIR